MKEEILVGVLPHPELGYTSSLEVVLIQQKDEQGIARHPIVRFKTPWGPEDYEAGSFLFGDDPFIVASRGDDLRVIRVVSTSERKDLAHRMKQFIRPAHGSFRVEWVPSDPSIPF